jgi:hypothetical protein
MRTEKAGMIKPGDTLVMGENPNKDLITVISVDKAMHTRFVKIEGLDHMFSSGFLVRNVEDELQVATTLEEALGINIGGTV